ncbi:uncharacterized protein LOC107459263 [Arachis duranensis]|uniref:Uncharacterized protein LOC107459263 n=1 Tax=Arachis duranensis TaxID=130453 RepID=A0A6P4AY27_ARADU|nr:uncharacterized protein LOC107459263 [Arachis duranensis]
MPGLSRELVEHQLPLKANVKPVKQPPRRFAPEVVQKIKEEIERLLKAKFIRTARYVNWISNIVPVMKKNGKLRVCIDFRDLNSATPKDEYPMLIVDMLIDSTAGHEMLSFMDGYSGYNQIYIAEKDVSKTAFRCPGNFLGFLVQKKRIEIDKNKAKAILEAPPPTNKKQLQAFLGKVNYLIRLRKWMLALTEFSLHFVPARAVKGQVLADFLVDHPCIDIDESLLGFVGLVEYEALIMGLELLLERGVKNVEIFGDSQLVVRQVSLEYRCVSKNLRKYFNVATELLSKFDNVIVRHVPRELNQEANELAQIASRYKIKPSTLEKLERIKDIFMPLREREVLSLEKLDPEDWRVPIVEYLKNPSLSVDRKLKYRAQSYVLISNVLFKKSVDENLLTCLGEKEAYLALAEVHEGICGAHQSGEK